MADSSIQSELLQLAISELPSVVNSIRNLFSTKNPDLPVPTSEEVMAAFNSAYLSSRTKDEAWQAAHPGQ